MQTLSQQRLSVSEWKRDEELFNEGVIGQRRYLETQSRYLEQNAALDERRPALRLAGMDKRDISQLEKSRQMTTQLNVRSPINGVVLERMSEAGRRLAVADPLYRIADTAQFWMEIRAPIEAVRNLAEGSLVQASAKPIQAAVIAVGHDVDAASQTVLVRAKHRREPTFMARRVPAATHAPQRRQSLECGAGTMLAWSRRTPRAGQGGVWQ